MAGNDVFTRQQLAVLSQLINAVIADQNSESDPRGLVPATVASYNPLTRYAQVVLDSDLEDVGPAPETRVFNKDWAQMQPGDRVFVQFYGTDGAAYIDGTIRTTDILVGCTMRDTSFTCPDSTLKYLTNLETVQYDPFGMYNPATGKVTIPDSGLWSGSLVILKGGSGFFRVFAELGFDGFDYRNANYFSGTAADPAVNAAIPPSFMNAGDVIDLRMFQDSAGAADFFVRVDVYAVQPGRLYT